MDQIKKADLYLYLLDASVPLQADDLVNIRKLPSDRCIIVRNKIDLGNIKPDPTLKDYVGIDISIAQNIGLEHIINSIKIVIKRMISLESMPDAVVSERHYHHLNKARHDLRDGLSALEGNNDQLIAAHHIRQAIALIGVITGRDVTEDILSSIFSKFCVGK